MTQYICDALNPNNMRTSGGTVYGKGWHSYPGMYAGGSITFERSSDSDETIKINGTISTTLYNGYSNKYGYPVTYKLYVGTRLEKSGTVVNYRYPGNYNTHLITFKDITVTLTNNTDSIDIIFYCNFNGIEGGCDTGTPATTVISLPAGKLPYKPYKKPTISISTDTDISVYDRNRTINVSKNDSGDNNSTNVKVAVNGKENSTSIDNGGGIYTFKPSDNYVGDGSSYTVKARRTHSQDSTLYCDSNELTLYTYRTPIIQNLQLDNVNFSGWGGVYCSWETNTRRWDLKPQEKDFNTHININNVWKVSTNLNPTGQSYQNTLSKQGQTLTEDFLNSVISTTDRCQPKVSTTITLRRGNPSSGVTADVGPKNITIQYQPKYAPSIIEYYSYKSSKGKKLSEGQTVYLDESPNIQVEWLLSSSYDRGVIDGFELYVYEDSTYSTKKSSHDIETENHNDVSGQKLLNTRKDLVRGQTNYIGVRAYYINPNGERMYGPELRQKFVLPVGRLHKPTISYPITNTQWHNNQFRILFELPEDDDYDVLSTQINNDTYTYKEIELIINGTKYTYTDNPNIFSVNKLGYKYRVCINPSLVLGFTNTTSYNIKLRVQKNYFVNLWSEYSDTINLNIIPVKRQNLVKDEIIWAKEYKYVQLASSRLHAVYPINDIPKGNVNRNKGDIIWAKDYQAIYDTILQIQNDVNTWARYDNKDNVKFNESILELSGSNNPKQDVITAKDDERPILTGRNYMNILVDCMNKLK